MNLLLIVGALLSALAALLHIGIIVFIQHLHTAQRLRFGALLSVWVLVLFIFSDCSKFGNQVSHSLYKNGASIKNDASELIGWLFARYVRLVPYRRVGFVLETEVLFLILRY